MKDWMDAHGISAETVASSLKVGIQTVKNWRSIGVPERRKAHVNYFMSTWKEHAGDAADLRQTLILRPTPDQFDTWNDAALAEGKRISSWALEGLDTLAREYEKGLRIVDETPQQREARWQRENSGKVAEEGK